MMRFSLVAATVAVLLVASPAAADPFEINFDGDMHDPMVTAPLSETFTKQFGYNYFPPYVSGDMRIDIQPWTSHSLVNGTLDISTELGGFVLTRIDGAAFDLDKFTLAFGSQSNQDYMALKVYNRGNMSYHNGYMDTNFDYQTLTPSKTNTPIEIVVNIKDANAVFFNMSIGNQFRVDNIIGRSAVPEPATWALMILGFVCVGAGMRRRQANERTRVVYN